ncbi:MAG TPA: hypothetical protein VFM72_04505 [Aequorivita sp.]|nr:hypothetical protein [Aequorivita sp.]
MNAIKKDKYRPYVISGGNNNLRIIDGMVLVYIFGASAGMVVQKEG